MNPLINDDVLTLAWNEHAPRGQPDGIGDLYFGPLDAMLGVVEFVIWQAGP